MMSTWSYSALMRFNKSKRSRWCNTMSNKVTLRSCHSLSQYYNSDNCKIVGVRLYRKTMELGAMIQFVVELVSSVSHKISDRYNHLTDPYLYCRYPDYWRPFTATFTSRSQSVKWTDRILTKPWAPRSTHITSRVGPRPQ